MNEQVPPLLRDLFVAYYDARKNKRMTASALRFELDFERNIFVLYEDIVARRYTISPSTCFVISEPIRREIFAGDFRDRIVHHLLFNYLNPLCERLFINDTYACRLGKGTSYGIRRADHFIRSVSQNYTAPCFVLKLDISGYFMSINRALLHEKVLAILKRYEGEVIFDVALVRRLLSLVIFHDHVRGCIIKGERKDWDKLPPSKSLFHARDGCGLPIGNLTSQLFGNIYMNEFDHAVPHMILGVRYARYVDDMLLVHHDKKVLQSAIPTIQAYLHHHIALTLHPKKIYLQHYTKGVDFLGVSVRKGHMYPRHRLKGNMYRAIALWNDIAEVGGGLDTVQVQALRSSLNSYLGNIGAYRTRTLRRMMLARLSPIVWAHVTHASSFRKVMIRKSDLDGKAVM